MMVPPGYSIRVFNRDDEAGSRFLYIARVEKSEPGFVSLVRALRGERNPR